MRARSHDPANVKRRFLSVAVVMAVSPLLVHALLHRSAAAAQHSVADLMGLRLTGLPAALVLPLLLTVVLFAGPLYAQLCSGELAAKLRADYWRTAFADIFWLRNHIVAPVAEEFTFRACMLPLLLAAVRPGTALALTPLFFGVAHLHHAVERYQKGMPLAQIAVMSLVQVAFTGVFGVYSAYLFVRTAHWAAPTVVHAFCNHMGVPDVAELFEMVDADDVSKERRRRMRWRVWLAYAVGLGGWALLLPVLTEPALYGNDVIVWQ